MPARAGFLVARSWVAAFVVLTAGVCLLAYIPFTYHQVVLGALLPWLSAFAGFHSYLYWLAFAAAGLSLPWRIRSTRLGSVLFLVVYGAVGLMLLFRPLLTRLENDLQSLLWSLVSLTPLVWLAALDWKAQSGTFRWANLEPVETQRLFRASGLTAIYAWLFSAILVLIRHGVNHGAELGAGQWALALSGSLLFHLLVFAVIFLALNFTGALAGVISKSRAVHSVFYAAIAAVMLALALRSIAFVPLSFSGPWAALVAGATAFSLVFFLSGTSVRLYRAADGDIQSPLALLLSPVIFLRNLSRTVQAIVLVIGSAFSAWLLFSLSTMDWEYMLQKLLVTAVWAAVFCFFYAVAPVSGKGSGDSLVVGAAVLVCLYVGSIALPSNWQLTGSGQKSLDEYANYDVSFRLTRGVLSPPVALAAHDSIYPFLVSNTNIPRSVHSDPVDINLAGNLTSTPGLKPNIFILVIDSLRRDYLSSYNSAVTFTPNIEAFARENVIVQNAFTRYTGTGLSEPSIWTGAMLLHKQYITPFYPMNSLQKLLEVERYQQFITKDEILSAILAPSKQIMELDAGRPTMSCELCRSLGELESRITAAKSAGVPMFAYTQPQNIHVSVINREGRSVPPGESYPGFDAPYASRVKALDQCFGEFIKFLKTSGIYDDSIVILTSDHGDSLGERGRWGHAYNVVPEVVRVPLLIHLPAAMRSLSLDQSAPAFLIDITPSLYYLLGHRPIVRSDLFGRPLFTATPEEVAGYLRSSYVVASSYGPVYGLLQNAGHSLYVADAVEYDDHLYDWDEGKPVSTDTVTPEIREDRQKQIQDYVSEIARFYGFNAATQTR